MTAIVFLGPTLSAEEARTALEAEFRPPVAQGDIYRAIREGPSAIGIVDGYFDGVPSVWHKEILWAIDRGIPVYGAASMGALRAAELHVFGMIGVGWIFEAFRDGRLVDDDEVAVLHAPAELGYRPLGEPMVSIRATLSRAAEEGILTPAEADELTARAKAMPYRERGWEALLATGAPTSLADWLPGGRIDQKRADALAMLRAMAEAEGAAAPPLPAPFEETAMWHELVARIEAEDAPDPRAAGVLDELRLDPDRFRAARERATLRALALDEAHRQGAEPDRSTLLAAMQAHRDRHRLGRRSDLDRWLARNGLDPAGYEALLHQSCQIEAGSALPRARIEAEMLAELRWTGAYARLAARAADKAEALEDGPSPAAAVPDRLARLLRFAETRLGPAAPSDPEAILRALGLETREELHRLLEREFLYSPGGQTSEPADD